MRIFAIALFPVIVGVASAQDAPKGPDGWQPAAPRDEIEPRFVFDPRGGPKGVGSLTILADQREGLHGWWQKITPITGGKFYRFHAVRKTHNVEVPRYSALARIVWQDDKGKWVHADPPPHLSAPKDPGQKWGHCRWRSRSIPWTRRRRTGGWSWRESTGRRRRRRGLSSSCTCAGRRLAGSTGRRPG